MVETAEQVRERMARVRAARGKSKGSAQVISIDQEFAARNQGTRVRFNTPIEGESDGITEGGNVEHQRPGLVTMYKPTPQGYMPRQVPATSIAVNLENGWKSYCPDCNGQHGGDPNECPGREPIAVRICPVCDKRIYDNRVFTGYKSGASDANDPNVIADDSYKVSTPATRTKAALDLHIWMRHPQEAREMNLPSLPTDPASLGATASSNLPAGVVI